MFTVFKNVNNNLLDKNFLQKIFDEIIQKHFKGRTKFLSFV